MKTLIEYGNYYHIYNRGNNSDNIFVEEKDYLHFLAIYDIYISSVAETYAWCLMKNHFHLLLRIKNEDEIGFLNSEYANSENSDLKWKAFFPKKTDKIFFKKPVPVLQLKHLFNAYSRWFNMRHHRTGSLFEKNFERKQVESPNHFTNLIAYIHNNPVKHCFVEDTIDYPWTSYLTIKSTKPTTLISRNKVIAYFDTIENFINFHQKSMNENEEKIKDLIIE